MRAVVADDDRGTATIVMNLLVRSNLEVAVAHDGNAAWDLLMTAPPPALAIIDWMMPGVDGLELCRRIKRAPSLAATHIILLTAKNSQEDVVAALDAGADDYLVKPFKFEELRTRVQVGIRIASLQERVVKSVAELQAARSGRSRRTPADLVQAADDGADHTVVPNPEGTPHELKPEEPAGNQ